MQKTVCFTTLGCKVNQYDSQAMLEDGIERVVGNARPGESARVASVRKIREAIDGLDDGDLVAIEFPEGGGIEVTPVKHLGS